MSLHKAFILNERALRPLGFTDAECEQLRRISMTLHRWHELECGTEYGCIEREERVRCSRCKAEFVDPMTHTGCCEKPRCGGTAERYGGKPHWRNSYNGRTSPVADRERGALKRLAALMVQHERYTAYVQSDPRGLALYILRPGDVPEGKDSDAYYSRGIAVQA